jgi:acetyl-CoA C-acetyltransferase
MKEVYIYDAVRTPRAAGQNSGPLQEIKPIQLLASNIQTLMQRYPQVIDHIGDLMIGCMTPVGEQGGNIARAAALYAGLPPSVAGMHINRFCASGLEAIQIAAAKILVGWENMVMVGGLESMNRVPEASDGGALMFDPAVRSAVNFIPRGVSADLLATLRGFGRTALDQHALLMHQRAVEAQEKKLLRGAIVPVVDVNQLPILEKNECLRHGISQEWMEQQLPLFTDSEERGYDAMARLRYPHIEEVQHLHTDGNSAQLADGAAVLLMGSREMGEALGLKARAKIRAAAVLGVEPTLMLHGAPSAARKALLQTGLSVQDIDLWEVMELFAAVGLDFQQELGLSADKVNIFGSDIAWGYAAGAMGATALGTLLDGLEQQDKQLGCVALCARGGMASAVIVERV